MTIAEMRRREVRRLAEFNRDVDFENASRLMNSFYRLCGLCETNLDLANDERRCNTRYTKASEGKEDKWYRRLDKTFHDTYGLNLCYCGYAPSIGVKCENGGFAEKITRWFYN